MPLHSNLSGTELHYPLGRGSEGALLLEDDSGTAYNISQGSDNQLNISTSNGAEKITIGNTATNPEISIPGSGNVGIGTDSPGSALEVKDGRITATDSDVAHGVTNVAATDAYGDFGPIHATYGGLMINGISDQESADARSLALRGISNDTHTDSVPLVEIIGAKRSGTSVQALADAETVLTVANHTSTRLTVLGSGNTGIGTTAPDKALEVNSADGNNLRLTHNDSDGGAANYVDLQVSSAGYIAARSSASKGQSVVITKCVPQTDSTAGNVTYTAAILMSGYILRDPNGSSRTDVTPTAAQIVAAIPNCAANDSFRFILKNTANAAEPITLSGGTGVTITGTDSVAQNNTKEWLVHVTNAGGGSEAVTIYSLGTWTH